MDVFLFPAQAEGLTNKQTRGHKVGNLGAGLVGVGIGKCLDAKRLGQTEALPHQGIRVHLGAAP